MNRQRIGMAFAVLGGVVILAAAFASSPVPIRRAWIAGREGRRRRAQTSAVVIHTTGRGLARVAAQAAPWGPSQRELDAYDRAALDWYLRTRFESNPHLLVGQGGTVFELMPQDRVAWHVAPGDKYPRNWPRPAWWSRRWPGHVTPIQILGQYPNNTTLAVDLLPDPSGRFTARQLDVAARLVGQLAQANRIPVRRGTVMGHSDLDPIARPNNSDPGLSAAQWSAFLAKAAA